MSLTINSPWVEIMTFPCRSFIYKLLKLYASQLCAHLDDISREVGS